MKKKILVCILGLCMGLIGCGSQTGEVQSTETQSTEIQEEETMAENVSTDPNYVLATSTEGVFVYDMNLCTGENLDDCEIWSYTNAGGLSGVRHREDTVFGDVVLICHGQRYAAILSYPEGEVIWEHYDAGRNAHDIEILPSGNILVASSTGNTLRLFATSALLENDEITAASYKEYELEEGHGVLWDPEYETVWAVGEKIINAYSVVGEGVNEELQLKEDMSQEAYGLDGHNLVADFNDINYLWITGKHHVYHFNKKTLELETEYAFSDSLDKMKVKGFGSTPWGSYCLNFPSLGIGTSWEKEKYASWSTDKIYFYRPNSDGSALEELECKSATQAFYKISSFYGKYQ